MMKIYTKTGDDGSTGLFGGARVSKADLRVGAFGTVDECNAALGMARMELARGEWVTGVDAAFAEGLDEVLGELQSMAFEIGAVLATPSGDRGGLGGDDVVQLENWIDRFEEGLPELRTFILPGGAPTAAALHLARTICRRAERVVTTLVQSADCQAEEDGLVLVILNRMSDLLFVLARVANALAGAEDVPWNPRR